MSLAETTFEETVFLPLNPSPESILHLRCGSDIYDGLREAGIPGVFLEVSDPVCQGPLDPQLSAEALRQARSDFIVTTYRGFEDRTAVLSKMEAEARGLAQIDHFAKIVLWFEHDLYDQATLIRLLAQLQSTATKPDKVFLINIDRFPGITRFNGLGQLSPEQLGSLWGTEKPVTPALCAEAERLWQAYSSGDPERLQTALDETDDALPFAAAAMQRHLQELPWQGNTLGLTEMLSLQALNEGAATPGRVFARLVGDLEPLPYLGDAMFWPTLKGLAAAPQPAVTDFSEWNDKISLTDFGAALLRGRARWTDHNRLDRWIGGLHLLGDQPPFLWDPESGRAIAAP